MMFNKFPKFFQFILFKFFSLFQGSEKKKQLTFNEFASLGQPSGLQAQNENAPFPDFDGSDSFLPRPENGANPKKAF